MRLVPIVLLLLGCQDYNLNRNQDVGQSPLDDEPTDDPLADWDGQCQPVDAPAEPIAAGDHCGAFGEGGFDPVVEWNLRPGKHSRATVAVGDVDGDGKPEIVANVTGLLGKGELVVAHGDGTGELWSRAANLGYASAPALADLDGDGSPEIVVVREYQTSLFGGGDYTLVAFDAEGVQVWESAHFTGDDFDYATSIAVSDMDHDGSPEVVAGRVILSADGSTRGKGQYGRGSMGGAFGMSEASISAIADLDLDGVEEVVVGDAAYRIDGSAIWHDARYNDGMVGIANLDGDPEGEIVAVTGNTVRALDTDGQLLWGPLTIETANIVSPPAIADVDVDGEPEILVAGGNSLLSLSAAGAVEWEAAVTDMTGASGASVFDFEGDGWPDVVYIDEIEMAVYDGRTGARRFHSTEHRSDTMYDYPVIADVDADGHAEIVVGHAGYSAAVSIYGDRADSWAPARKVWNQHAYSVNNVNDDLTVPVAAVPAFTTHNSWHAALDRAPGEALDHDLDVEVLDVCEDDCDDGVAFVTARARNRASVEVPAGLKLALYASVGGARQAVDVRATTAPIPPLTTGEPLAFEVPADVARAATALWVRVDDDGTGTGAVAECSELDNEVIVDERVCD